MTTKAFQNKINEHFEGLAPLNSMKPHHSHSPTIKYWHLCNNINFFDLILSL